MFIWGSLSMHEIKMPHLYRIFIILFTHKFDLANLTISYRIDLGTLFLHIGKISDMDSLRYPSNQSTLILAAFIHYLLSFPILTAPRHQVSNFNISSIWFLLEPILELKQFPCYWNSPLSLTRKWWITCGYNLEWWRRDSHKSYNDLFWSHRSLSSPKTNLQSPIPSNPKWDIPLSNF